MAAVAMYIRNDRASLAMKREIAFDVPLIRRQLVDICRFVADFRKPIALEDLRLHRGLYFCLVLFLQHGQLACIDAEPNVSLAGLVDCSIRDRGTYLVLVYCE